MQIAHMCETYKEMKPQNLPEPLKQHSDGDEPWQKIDLDFFEIAGKHYLVVVGYYSNFIDIGLMTTMTSACTVTSLKKYCAHYGIPRMIVSLFVDNWGITHNTSSPMHQRASGGAESAVKIMKTLLVKHAKEGGDPCEAMLGQRKHSSSRHRL